VHALLNVCICFQIGGDWWVHSFVEIRSTKIAVRLIYVYEQTKTDPSGQKDREIPNYCPSGFWCSPKLCEPNSNSQMDMTEAQVLLPQLSTDGEGPA
jgi:hypothetical protein